MTDQDRANLAALNKAQPPRPRPPNPRDHRGELRRFVRFRQLQQMGVVGDWPTLLDYIERLGFPPGYKLSHKVRIWDQQSVFDWIEARKVAA
jgi:predicted DNA-binding transcriptional regulator AlpA